MLKKDIFSFSNLLSIYLILVKSSLAVGDDEISPSSTAKNLINCHLKLDKYINATCKSSFFPHNNTSSIRNCLSNESARIIKLGYCNLLLYGLSDFQMQCLQNIRTITVHIFTKSKRDSHIASISRSIMPLEHYIHTTWCFLMSQN